MTRLPCQTLLVWAQDLESQGATVGAQFLRHYCAVRYGQPEVGPEDLEQLAQERQQVQRWVTEKKRESGSR